MDYLRVGTAQDLKNPKEKTIFRIFEIFPGALSWVTLFLAIILSWLRPFWISYFILIFIIYWLVRTIYLAFHLRTGFVRMKESEKIDWLKKLEDLPATNYSLPTIESWKDIYHLVLLPNYKEPYEVIKEGLESIISSDFPKEKIAIVLSFEEKAGSERRIVAKRIKNEFKGKFFKLLVTFHPANLPDEIPGHGSNDAWAAKEAKEKIFDPICIPYENIIVSSFDVDTKVFPKYFSCLTWHYLISKNPTQASFQPVPLYNNNIWQAPMISRVFSFSSTFWQIMCQERPEKLITFSGHAMSFKALVDVGFKQRNIVSDDSRIFWQCFFKYDGDYRVVPIFYPISMDANVAKTFWKTILNLYKQQKRWAYGVGDISYLLFGFIKNKKISLRKKISWGFQLIEGHWSWAVAPILIFSLGLLPIFLGNEEFTHSMVAYSLPKLTSRMMTIAMIGLVGSVYFSLLLLPPKPPEYGKIKYLIFIFGWFLVPTTMIFFSSLPALDAQTRLVFGKYMGFWVTPKIRKK